MDGAPSPPQSGYRSHMGGVVEGVLIIGSTIILGWVMQRIGVLPPQAATVLSAFVYWAATPALLFSVISVQDVAEIFGAPFLAAVVSGIGTAVIFVLLAWPMRVRGGDLVLGAMSSSVNNIAYMGIPVAIYVLGSAHHVVPVMAFQLGFLTPFFFVMAELSGKSEPVGGAARLRQVLRTVFTNPMVLAALLGGAVAISGITLPSFITEFSVFVGDAAPATILVAFGASLVGQSVRLSGSQWVAVSWATVAKLLVQPALAGLVGWWAGLEGVAMAGVILMAALPTAQNAYIASMRARAGREVTQGTVLLTTALSLPLIIGWVAALTAAGIFVP